MATMKKPTKRGRGRPRTNITWKGISVRFLESEKAAIERAGKRTDVSQAEVIRRGAVLLAGKIERERLKSLP